VRKESRLKEFYERLAKKKGNNKAGVATARKLLCIIWHMLKYREPYAY
jgi:transposase